MSEGDKGRGIDRQTDRQADRERQRQRQRQRQAGQQTDSQVDIWTLDFINWNGSEIQLKVMSK